jgi:hypothetical protein
MKPQPLTNADHILDQATRIRDIAQRIIDACQTGQVPDPYARNKITSGSLAQDAAVLAIMLVQHNMENAQVGDGGHEIERA